MTRSAREVADDVSSLLASDPPSSLMRLLAQICAHDERADTALEEFRRASWTLPHLAERLALVLETSPSDRARVDEAVAPLIGEAHARMVADDAVTLLGQASPSVVIDLDTVLSASLRDLPELARAKAEFECDRLRLPAAAHFEQLLGDALATDPERLTAVEDATSRAVAQSVLERWHSDNPPTRLRLGAILQWVAHAHADTAEPITALLDGHNDRAASDALIETLARTVRVDPDARSLLLASYADGRRPRRDVRDIVLHRTLQLPPSPGPSRGDLLETIVRAHRDESAQGGAESPAEPREAGTESPTEGIGEAPASGDRAAWPAYPLLHPVGFGPDDDFAITAGAAFELEVGIHLDVDFGLAATGGLGEVAAGVPITIHLAYDPASFLVEGELPVVITPDDQNRYPTATVAVTPLARGHEGGPNRRIAAHYLIDGSLRGIAVRTFRVAGTRRLPSAATPTHIDLSPLAAEDAPDVVVAIYHADTVAEKSYCVAVFPRALEGPLPPVETIDLTHTADVYIQDFYAIAEADDDALARYRLLTGRALAFGSKIPPATRAALQAIAESATKSAPATMLLLTDDTLVPWELAAFPDQVISSKAGGNSPFLGAHFAIGRWPIDVQVASSKRPEVRPIDVRRAALVTADYDDGWGPLPHALKEVKALAKSYSPAEIWKPGREELLHLLADEVDVLHFALHGTSDPRDIEDGLVLMEERDGAARAVYLGATILRSRIREKPPTLPRRPLVFLNACKVGRTQSLLGDYGGLAAAFLEAGARAVVACLWNIDDDAAGLVSKEFYRSADRNVPPAEILRRVRTRYRVTEQDAAHAPGPTLIAYQYFGHPNLRVARPRKVK